MLASLCPPSGRGDDLRSLLDLPEEYIRPEWRKICIPGRPWWLIERHPTYNFIWRRDGLKLGEWNHDKAASLDSEHPLPHPGFRVGQIWALFWEQTTAVVGPLTISDLIHPTLPLDTLVFEDYCSLINRRQINSWGGTLTTLEYRHILGTILLHDPCRPDLAPWSSK